MNTLVIRILCLLIGYGFGSIQCAYIYGRIRGVDIRKVGSGNAGTTNVMRAFGTKAGFLVLFGDIAKCIVAILLVEHLFGTLHPEMRYLLKIYAAAGCVLGHDFPFYLGFRGGKGIAVTAGYLIAFHWTFIPMGLAAFLIPFLTTHFVSLGSLCLYAGFWILLVIEGQMGLYGMPVPLLLEMYIIGALMTALAFYQHRENIVRLIKGQERKTYLFRKFDKRVS